jgi:methyltransferase-like protein 6
MDEQPEKYEEEITKINKQLNEFEITKLKEQDGRLVSEVKANKLEVDAKRNWDLFYKRNETRFFKDRRWTTREFQELIYSEEAHGICEKKFMLEIGCGVGNLIYPLIEENRNNYFIYACDFSPRAIEFVKNNPLYNEERVIAFTCDITTETIFNNIKKESLDIITMIFVLSAIHPGKFQIVFDNLFKLLKPGGKLLFRDYGLYDMAQIRFKPGHKIADKLYMRQDGTRTYYFSEEEMSVLVRASGYEILENNYVYRRTINPKENVDVERIFLQGKYIKPML